MLLWNISYPDTFRAISKDCTFTISKDKENYHIWVRVRVGDEFFEKSISGYKTLQDANEECQRLYQNMNK